MVEIEIREGNDVFISWLEPRLPHGRILHYNIRIIQSGRETIIKEYNKTSISWDTWTNDWKISNSENVKIQVSCGISNCVDHEDFVGICNADTS